MSALEFTSFLFPKSPYYTACYQNSTARFGHDYAQYLEFSRIPSCPNNLRDLAVEHHRVRLIGCGVIDLSSQQAKPWRSPGDSLCDPLHPTSTTWIIDEICLFAMRINATPSTDVGHALMGYRILCSAQSRSRALMLPFGDQFQDCGAIDITTSSITEYSVVPTPRSHRTTDGQPTLYLADLSPMQLVATTRPTRKRA